jgi:organic hydroperoxide reductase OsmC/OhrA
MRDLAIRLAHRPGALADMGEALGAAGVSIEGGGGFAHAGEAIVHFLFEDGAAARRALGAAGIEVLDDREVIAQRLDQATPGQLGSLARAMGEAGVNIEVVYSDHDHRLILGVDDSVRARAASAAWSGARPQAPKPRQHHYAVALRWIGNHGTGTSGYRDYARDHVIGADGKPEIPASSDPHFRGDAGRWNPEELLVAALASCHQLAYLHLCAVAGVVVTAYEDHPEGSMAEDADGGGHFTRVVLRPRVTISAGSDRGQALSLHHRAHALCFIARSVNFAVDCEPEITTE